MAAGAYPAVPRPVCRDSRVRATYSSAWQSAVKLASLAYPASHRALPIGLVIPAAASTALALASSGCSALVSDGLSWVPMARITCFLQAMAWALYSWSKPPFFSGMTRLPGSVRLTFSSGAGAAAAAAPARAALSRSPRATACTRRTSRLSCGATGAPPLGFLPGAHAAARAA